MGIRATDIMSERMSLSFEVFPPKPTQPMEPLLGCLDELYKLSPDFISCTYGAVGTAVGRNTEVCKAIQDAGKAIAVTHFTCIGNTKEGVKERLQNYLDMGVNHVLALRGDLPAGWEGTRGDFSYASELIKFIRDEFGGKFTIAMGAAPEKHIQCDSFEADIAHLKHKQDQGADYIMTQFCHDVEHFERWADKLYKAGVTLPMDVGVMPVLNKEATIRMCLSMNGCSIPRDLAEVISRYYNNPDDFRKAGMEYTVKQIHRYINVGIEGLHLYALNKSDAVKEICEAAGIASSK